MTLGPPEVLDSAAQGVLRTQPPVQERSLLLRVGLRLVGTHTRAEWLACGALAVLLLLIIPSLHALLPATSPLHIPDRSLSVLGKFLCYGIVALAVDLIWGFAGILSLGHGVFFALGGYALGMHMMRAMAGQGVYRSQLPDFMVFLDWKELPWYWRGFDQLPFALAVAVVLPAALAFVFGYFAFSSRIRGVYFSIITQAMTFAFMLWFFRNETGFGGNNGLTDFKQLYGYVLAESATKRWLYVMTVAALGAIYLVCRLLVTGRIGRVLRALRDHEAKVRFTGYNPMQYKLLAWTLSAALCGIAGALYVAQVGIINPSEMHPANSIEMAIWVAVGGRATLGGAVLGALVVNALKSTFTALAPEYWLYVLGGLFVGVTLLLPGGLVSLRLPGRRARTGSL
jgi:urea transport system permease protein